MVEPIKRSTPKWESVTIAGKPVEVFRPGDEVPRCLVIYLHSFQGESLAQRAIWAEHFVAQGLACICPPGGQSWWSDRICTEYDDRFSAETFLLSHVIPWFCARWNLPRRSLALLGVNMGGQGALRLAFKHPHLFPVVAALGPSIEYHELYWSGLAIDEMYRSKEECRQDTAPMHINPHDFPLHIFFSADPEDPWWRGCDRLREKLTALGIAHRCDLTTRAGGHTWAYFDAYAERAIRFVREALERESRRLL